MQQKTPTLKIIQKKMFNNESVFKAVEIQKLGYVFLMYITDKIDSKKFTFSRIHEDENAKDVFLDWINNYYDYLPQRILPKKNEIEEFSNYFVSYLTTSFVLTDEPERQNNVIGCNCDICLKMISLSHLKPLSPNNWDRELADEKRVEIIKELGNFLEVNLTDEVYLKIAYNSEYIQDTAYLAYTKSLFERIKFAKGGRYILALWRQIAWHEGKPIKGFELKADNIMKSMRKMEILLKKDEKNA